MHSWVTSKKLIAGWLSAHELNARCIAACRSLHSTKLAKKRSSRKRRRMPREPQSPEPSHAHAMPPPRPRVLSVSAGYVQRKPSWRWYMAGSGMVQLLRCSACTSETCAPKRVCEMVVQPLAALTCSSVQTAAVDMLSRVFTEEAR